MIPLARERPLSRGERRYRVRYAPEAVPEFAERDDAEALMDEVEAVLGADPFSPPGRRAEKVEGEEPLRRYRPHADNDSRVFYAVEGHEVWVLGVHPRKTAYRAGNLRAAAHRLRRLVGEG